MKIKMFECIVNSTRFWTSLIVVFLLLSALLTVLLWKQRDAEKKANDPTPSPAASTNVTITESDAEDAYRLMETISTNFPHRTHIDSQPDLAAAKNFIVGQLQSFGYTPESATKTYSVTVNPFGTFDEPITNIYAKKETVSEKQIIVAAHYDTSDFSPGAADNASGIGVLLTLAKKFQNVSTPYDVLFIAMDDEERGDTIIGGLGSSSYASHMSQEEVNNTIAMINLDTLMGGDKLYVHSGKRGATSVRDMALTIAQEKNIALETNPGLNSEYPKGTTGNWGDHVGFMERGIPIAYFESTNWEIGAKDGYTQSVKGSFFNTVRDNLPDLTRTFGKSYLTQQLRDFLVVTAALMEQIK